MRPESPATRDERACSQPGRIPPGPRLSAEDVPCKGRSPDTGSGKRRLETNRDNGDVARIWRGTCPGPRQVRPPYGRNGRHEIRARPGGELDAILDRKRRSLPCEAALYSGRSCGHECSRGLRPSCSLRGSCMAGRGLDLLLRTGNAGEAMRDPGEVFLVLRHRGRESPLRCHGRRGRHLESGFVRGCLALHPMP